MKKVEIETECGETTIVYVSQDIKKITVDGEELASSDYEPKNAYSVERMLGVLLGGSWRFHTNQDEKTFKESLTWYHESGCSTFSIPIDPADIVYVPHHWMRDGAKRHDDAIGVYFREGVKMVNPRHVFLSTP